MSGLPKKFPKQRFSLPLDGGGQSSTQSRAVDTGQGGDDKSSSGWTPRPHPLPQGERGSEKFLLPQKFSLQGRAAVVTGICGNLGPIWAETLLEAGAEVAGLDLPQAKKTDVFLKLGRRYSNKFLFVPCDIRDRKQLLKAKKKINDGFRSATVLVNNAGIDQPPAKLKESWTFEDIPAEICRKVLEINFLGAFQAIQIFGPDMIKLGHGSIINIGSVYAEIAPDRKLYEHFNLKPPFLKPPAYGASKAALINLTKYLAVLWGPYGIRVNALSPGGVEGNQDAKFKQKYTAKVPLGRMARPADLDGPLLFLASDASSYMTGAHLIVDGGLTAW
ncbi:MAG: SDR family oxidoreductase [Elusimicrobia bacterium]|nr:SDR family oxidoreductase [Elusimicrobiota bacterium]